MSGIGNIYDNVGIKSIDFNNRLIYDTTTVKSIDYANRQLLGDAYQTIVGHVI